MDTKPSFGNPTSGLKSNKVCHSIPGSGSGSEKITPSIAVCIPHNTDATKPMMCQERVAIGGGCEGLTGTELDTCLKKWAKDRALKFCGTPGAITAGVCNDLVTTVEEHIEKLRNPNSNDPSVNPCVIDPNSPECLEKIAMGEACLYSPGLDNCDNCFLSQAFIEKTVANRQEIIKIGFPAFAKEAFVTPDHQPGSEPDVSYKIDLHLEISPKTMTEKEITNIKITYYDHTVPADSGNIWYREGFDTRFGWVDSPFGGKDFSIN